jgi:hypothetical protein
MNPYDKAPPDTSGRLSPVQTLSVPRDGKREEFLARPGILWHESILIRKEEVDEPEKRLYPD